MKYFINKSHINLIKFFLFHHFHIISFQIFQIRLLFVFQFHLQSVQHLLPLTQNIYKSNRVITIKHNYFSNI